MDDYTMHSCDCANTGRIVDGFKWKDGSWVCPRCHGIEASGKYTPKHEAHKVRFVSPWEFGICHAFIE